MTYLFFSGWVGLIFGSLLMIAPNFFTDFFGRLDRVVFVIDDILSPFREIVGVLLLVAGGVILYVSSRYPALIVLRLVWVVAGVFGLLYLLLPNWLDVFSRFANRIIFPTRKYMVGTSKLIGLFILAGGVYILVMAYFVI
jgi:hypothetical protein